MRPFACLHYICPRLHEALGSTESAVVEQALERARALLRTELHAAFVEPA
ncbi:hypothetical protein DFAR_260010 [Desulfarculales bacterium]